MRTGQRCVSLQQRRRVSRSAVSVRHLYNRANRFPPRGLFGVPGFTSPASLQPIAAEAVKKCQTIVEHVTSTPRPKDVILLLDELSNALCLVVDAAELCRNVHPDPQYVQAATDTIMDLSSYMQTLNTNKELYSALVTALEEEGKQWPEEWSRTAVLLQQDFEQYGIHLSKEDQAVVNQLHDEMNQLSSMFSFNAVRHPPPLQISESLLAALPPPVQQMVHHVEDGNIEIPMDPVTANTVLRMCSHPDLRAAVFRYTSSSMQNLQVLPLLEHISPT